MKYQKIQIDHDHVQVKTESGHSFTMPSDITDQQLEIIVPILEAIATAQITLNANTGQISIVF